MFKLNNYKKSAHHTPLMNMLNVTEVLTQYLNHLEMFKDKRVCIGDFVINFSPCSININYIKLPSRTPYFLAELNHIRPAACTEFYIELGEVPCEESKIRSRYKRPDYRGIEGHFIECMTYCNMPGAPKFCTIATDSGQYDVDELNLVIPKNSPEEYFFQYSTLYGEIITFDEFKKVTEIVGIKIPNDRVVDVRISPGFNAISNDEINELLSVLSEHLQYQTVNRL